MIITGELPTVQGTLYTVPSNRSATIGFIRVSNSSGAARTCTIYVNTSGTANPITPVSVQLPIGALLDDFPVLELHGTSKIEGVASDVDVLWVMDVRET